MTIADRNELRHPPYDQASGHARVRSPLLA